ncbi:MAG: DUF2461 domain-containing protein [Luteibaculum sp.]
MSSYLQNCFQFLSDLNQNNNRDWFTANKNRYVEAKLEFEAFVQELILSIAEWDSTVLPLQAKDCVFRIYRDVRFSKDKRPYKTNFGAHISAATKKSEVHSHAGYYIHLQPGNTFLGGGAYQPHPDWLKAIREEISQNANELREIISDKVFKQYFGEMEGEQLKTAPRDYPKDHPEIELLRYKSFLAMHQVPDKSALSPDFLEHCNAVFKALKPFDNFLNNSLSHAN